MVFRRRLVRTLRTVGKPHGANDVPPESTKICNIPYKKSNLDPKPLEDFGSLFKCVNTLRGFGSFFGTVFLFSLASYGCS